MLAEGRTEETWKIVIQSYASKVGIRSDLNSKGDLDWISWQNLEDLQIQRMCSHIWRTAAMPKGQPNELNAIDSILGISQ
jgi:hypothetical protein